MYFTAQHNNSRFLNNISNKSHNIILVHDTYYTLYITVAHRVMCNSVYVTLHIEILLYVMYSTIFFY